ncbi:MAG: thioredoxin domain-containing protein [Rhodobacteraceae bacterium]|nr:thioredoxin domain-containing protein [Paracoccaceae bacterium]
MYRLFAALFVTILAIAPVHAQSLTTEDVKRLVLETILENPEIVMEAVAILQQREQAEQAASAAAALVENEELLFNDPQAEVLGNPDGDVTVVEFFDYNCHFCRESSEAVASLLESDPNVRLVMREFPILSEGSVEAARVALAARNQDGYEAFHWALMSMKGQAQLASVLKLARDNGLDVDQLRVDMNAPEIDEHIENSRALAAALGISGTPSFVVGNTLVPGAVPLEQLQQIIAQEREN